MTAQLPGRRAKDESFLILEWAGVYRRVFQDPDIASFAEALLDTTRAEQRKDIRKLSSEKYPVQ